MKSLECFFVLFFLKGSNIHVSQMLATEGKPSQLSES